MRSLVSLHVNFRNLGVRWPLRDDHDIEVWTNQSQLIATLSGQLIRHLVELHLGTAALQGEIQALVRKPPVPLLPIRTIIGAERRQREELRKQRRSRKRA